MANWIGSESAASDTPYQEGVIDDRLVLVDFEVGGFLKDTDRPPPPEPEEPSR